MILSALAFTVQNGFIRWVDHIPTMELVFFRSFSSLLICLVLLKRLSISLPGNRPSWLVARGVVGVISMAIFFKAFQIMPMGTIVSMRYLSPIFAAFMAVYFLKERIYAMQWLFFLIAFGGVVMLKGFDARVSMYGLGLAFLTAFFSGMVYVILRKIGNSEHPILIVGYFMAMGVLVGGIGMMWDWQQPIGVEWVVLLTLGIFGFFGQYFMTRAFQVAEANVVAPFKYAEAVFTLAMGWAIFDEYQTIWSLLAIALIISSLVGNVWVKKHKEARN